MIVVNCLKIKLTAFLLLAIVLFSLCFAFSASAIKIDGIMNDSSWIDSDSVVFVSSADNPNCDVEFASVSVLTDKKSNQILLGFRVELSNAVENSSDYGVAVSINSDEFVYIIPSGVSAYDIDKYSADGSVSLVNEKYFVAEVAIGMKYGLSSVKSIDVRAVDSHGMPSNVYQLDVDSVLADLNDVTEYDKNDDPDTTKKRKSTTKKTSDKNKSTTNKTDMSETADMQNDPYAEWFESKHNTPYDEETTVLTMKQIKLQRGFSYAAVAALILLALGICVAVNVKHDKNCK